MTTITIYHNGRREHYPDIEPSLAHIMADSAEQCGDLYVLYDEYHPEGERMRFLNW